MELAGDSAITTLPIKPEDYTIDTTELETSIEAGKFTFFEITFEPSIVGIFEIVVIINSINAGTLQFTVEASAELIEEIQEFFYTDMTELWTPPMDENTEAILVLIGAGGGGGGGANQNGRRDCGQDGHRGEEVMEEITLIPGKIYNVTIGKGGEGGAPGGQYSSGDRGFPGEVSRFEYDDIRISAKGGECRAYPGSHYNYGYGDSEASPCTCARGTERESRTGHGNSGLGGDGSGCVDRGNITKGGDGDHGYASVTWYVWNFY